MNIYKEMIESMERIAYAEKKQKEGNISYISIEMGNRDFISSIWNAIEKGIRQGRSEISDKLKKQGIELAPYTDEEVKNLAREMIVKGCYDEGCSKEYLKEAFGLNDDILEGILRTIKI